MAQCDVLQCHSTIHLTEKNSHYNKQIIKFGAGKKQNISVCLSVRVMSQSWHGGVRALLPRRLGGKLRFSWSDRAEC